MPESSREQEFGAHLRETLGVDVPEAWKALWEYAPWAMEAYFEMRKPIFDTSEEEIPTKYLELIIVALDIALNNEWGMRAHVRAALEAGASKNDVVKTVVITIMACGMPSFRKTGYLALEELDAFLHSRD